MKSLGILGWAVIFSATILLVACSTHAPKVTHTDIMSGPDETITQPTEEKVNLERRENALAINQAWLDERETRLDRKESALALRENALAVNQAWLTEFKARLEKKEFDLEVRENALAVNNAWLEEFQTQLHQKESALDRRENALVVNRAWLDEREARISGPTTEGKASLMAAASPRNEAESGHCYASILMPAQYRTVAVTKPIDVPQGENLPVIYQTVTERVKVADEHYVRKEILCDTSLTVSRVIEIQRRLAHAGYDLGPIDGIIGDQTMSAINDFQRDSGLTIANHVTIETIKALKLNF